MTLKKRSQKTLSVGFGAVALLVLSAAGLSAQSAKIDIDGVKAQTIKTPKFNISNIPDKKWKPKDWIEIETVFKIKLASRELKTADNVRFKYYVVLDADRDKLKTLVGEVTHTGIPVKENSASSMYISPASIAKLTGKSGASESLVKFWGVEVYYNGELVGGESSNNKKWWTSGQAPPQERGVLLDKTKTPFAPLWGDYHADVTEGS